mgnify:CR=1 FL=1
MGDPLHIEPLGLHPDGRLQSRRGQPAALSAAELLQPGRVVRASIATGGERVFRIALPSGSAALCTVEQGESDLAIAVAGPDGRTTHVDGFERGPETVTISAAEPGEFQLLIRRAGAGRGSVEFSVRLDAVRAPTPEDALRSSAEQAATEAKRLAAPARGCRPFQKTAGGEDNRCFSYKEDAPEIAPRANADQVIVTCPDCETRATKGPGREWRTRYKRGNAARKTAAISLPRRFPAVRTNTLALLARSALISNGRYLNLWSFVSTPQPRSPTVLSQTRSSSSRAK